MDTFSFQFFSILDRVRLYDGDIVEIHQSLGKTLFILFGWSSYIDRMDDNDNKTSKTQIKHLQTETLMNCNGTNLSP